MAYEFLPSDYGPTIHMPSVIYRHDDYIAALRVMAWNAAGWAAWDNGSETEAWGPLSIRHSIDLDIAEMVGCLDARLDAASPQMPGRAGT